MYWLAPDDAIYLLLIFPNSKKDTLTADEIAVLHIRFVGVVTWAKHCFLIWRKALTGSAQFVEEKNGFSTYDVEPRQLPDVFAERPVVVFGKWKGTSANASRGKLTLTGVSGRGRFVSTIDAATVAPDSKNAALSYLWARARISELSDFYAQDAHRQAIVDESGRMPSRAWRCATSARRASRATAPCQGGSPTAAFRDRGNT